MVDKNDEKILNLIQTDGRLSVKRIGQALSLSGPAISQRLANLKDEGIIRGYRADIDLNKLDLSVRAFVQVDVSPDKKSRFYEFVKPISNVLECNVVTGPYSMLLKVAFQVPEELDDLINKLQRFGKTNTLMVFSTPVRQRGFFYEIN
ncbi:MAG: Lrp/AsnC family transcriptional regulator [Lentilactobacillus diolivorans]|jgi:Lrp/AsnC family leucine-responsive transcriptional regulator|uniref:AsnC family transcription regulator n=2 Tax=Lentilactobacillus diolivorans TaxID=179838 RepID=A0A0R1SJL4_9LACO|nr:Lrp/AsnC family transcriptional regulator [Lentilactobacillus diolivorans]RRG03518.1 MAG: Lrp/AsnC family transcriptional regulator [Lactobacillus sp.]KRL65019.1 AsnC family transcription regulator [Lentilactobacillus diolivorans DSM 14421]MCH4164173.1 Lrp/AsnC family transcriptional regulator [Lentilactobacillus diolivorans]MDH5106371.1 Lrp/AsnC family transcriptional regulator [Lentilactobacillus diolivorans]GEP25263.1 transcriptional regulator [Lentilactobacillus diolivorans]